MPFIPIPNGVSVEMIYTMGTQRFENVYTVTKGTPATLADLNALVTLMRNWEQVTARLQRTNQVFLVQVDATALDAPGAPAVTVPVLPSIGGSQNNGITAGFITVAVKHTSGLSGRSFRGRSYWIGLGATDITFNDLLSQARVDAIAATYNTLRTNLLAAGWTFCIASKYSGVTIVDGRRRAVPRAVGILTPVAASTAERGIDTNRHRKLPYQV